MKRTMTVLAALLAILAAFVIARVPKPQWVSAAPLAAPAPAPEPHPEIRAAMHHLEEAQNNLEKAAHDFGGHRVKALEHTRQALEECREALKFDR